MNWSEELGSWVIRIERQISFGHKQVKKKIKYFSNSNRMTEILDFPSKIIFLLVTYSQSSLSFHSHYIHIHGCFISFKIYVNKYTYELRFWYIYFPISYKPLMPQLKLKPHFLFYFSFIKTRFYNTWTIANWPITSMNLLTNWKYLSLLGS